MNEKQRHNPGANPDGSDAGGPAGGGKLDQTRQRAEAFHAAADAAIKNVISGDSAKFNQAARQEGGE